MKSFRCGVNRLQTSELRVGVEALNPQPSLFSLTSTSELKTQGADQGTSDWTLKPTLHLYMVFMGIFRYQMHIAT